MPQEHILIHYGVSKLLPGEVAEWSNVPDSKSGVPKGTGGSNPSLSANQNYKKLGILRVKIVDFIGHISKRNISGIYNFKFLDRFPLLAH